MLPASDVFRSVREALNAGYTLQERLPDGYLAFKMTERGRDWRLVLLL